MTEKLFLVFAGPKYYPSILEGMIGVRKNYEEALALGKAHYEKDLEVWGSPDYCWYCVVGVDSTTLEYKTLFDSRGEL